VLCSDESWRQVSVLAWASRRGGWAVLIRWPDGHRGLAGVRHRRNLRLALPRAYPWQSEATLLEERASGLVPAPRYGQAPHPSVDSICQNTRLARGGVRFGHWPDRREALPGAVELVEDVRLDVVGERVSGRAMSSRSTGTSGAYLAASLPVFGPLVWMRPTPLSVKSDILMTRARGLLPGWRRHASRY